MLFGRADIGRGEVTFEGRRYRVTRGAIDFTNPNRIEPFFDVEAETNVRVPGGPTQRTDYRVTVGAAGTTERMSNLKFESDPPLPTADVLALLLSDVQRNDVPELRALRELEPDAERHHDGPRDAGADQSDLDRSRTKVLQQTVGLDTFQLSPSFVDPTNASRLNPTARLTIGKRISDRAFVTFSRSLNTTFNDQIIQLEFDASDRLYWLISRNEDQQTYADRVPREARVLPWHVRGCKRSASRAGCRDGLSHSRIAGASPARAAIADYLGKPIAAVRFVIEGRDTDRSVAVGCRRDARRASRCRWPTCARASSHLYSLGRFEDVRVDASA